MLKFYASAAMALLFLSVPATAQVRSPADGKITIPSAQNSGAGIPGQPGNKSGPAPKASETSGTRVPSNPDETVSPTQEGDSAKIPGKPGGKAGPAVTEPPADTNK